MFLLLFFSAFLLLASLSYFFPLGIRALAFCSPCWSRGSLLLPGWFRGDVLCRIGRRRCDRSVWCSFEGFACAHLVQSRPFPLHCRGLQAAVSPSHWPCSSWGERDGCICTGGRLICQLRQLGPPLCGPPHRQPSPRTPRMGLVKGKTPFEVFPVININILYDY